MTKRRAKKYHIELPAAVEAALREALKQEGETDGGVYVYVRHINGHRSPTPPFTEEDKSTIRRMYNKEKATVSELSQLYGKSRQAIYSVLREPDEF
jgi:DNA invertase Pin-like site-specific DNA recombinase